MRAAVSIARSGFGVAAGLCLAVLAAGAALGAGPIVGWGAGAQPPAISASAIAVGGEHYCAVEAGTGAVVCWGIKPPRGLVEQDSGVVDEDVASPG